MSLFAYSYGQAEPIAVSLSSAGMADVFVAGNKQAVIVGLRAALRGASDTTSLELEVFDGTSSFAVRGAKALSAFEVVTDQLPIVLPPGWSLRAIRGAGDAVDVTGVVITQAGN